MREALIYGARRSGGGPVQVPALRLEKAGASGQARRALLVRLAGAPTSLCHTRCGFFHVGRFSENLGDDSQHFSEPGVFLVGHRIPPSVQLPSKETGSVNRTAPCAQGHYALSHESRHGDAPGKGAPTRALLSCVISGTRPESSGLCAETPKLSRARLKYNRSVNRCLFSSSQPLRMPFVAAKSIARALALHNLRFGKAPIKLQHIACAGDPWYNSGAPGATVCRPGLFPLRGSEGEAQHGTECRATRARA